MNQRASDAPRDDSDPNALPLSEARRRILAALQPVSGQETLPLLEAIERISAARLLAPVAVPPFRASAMDGYAYRSGDGGNRRHIEASSLAGHPGPDALTPGACQRITTGARVPDDADTVVQQEDVRRDGDAIEILDTPPLGTNVRAAGSAGKTGDTLVDPGERLGSATLAVLASHGIDRVVVTRRLRVGLLSTGDELCEPCEQTGRGQIHDANRVLLSALLRSPLIETVDLGIAADTPDALVDRIARAPDIDVLVSSGGVSVGDADHVRDVLAGSGAVTLWKIAMKPGRPLAFGQLNDGLVWFGLPGNPVSAAITSLLLVIPALTVMAGGTPSAMTPARHAVLDRALSKRPGRVEFQRGRYHAHNDGRLHVSDVGAQDSHVLRSLQQANCLIELPAASSGAAAGESVKILRFEDLGTSPF